MEAEHTDASDLNVAEMLCFEVALRQQQLQEYGRAARTCSARQRARAATTTMGINTVKLKGKPGEPDFIFQTSQTTHHLLTMTHSA